MDQVKRDRLIAELAAKPEPHLVPIAVFFDGNDDLGSIGCNLVEHPGIELFRSTFARLATRDDVHSIFAEITELDPGEGSWPFSDTVLVFGTISPEELASELALLEPDEVGVVDECAITRPAIQRLAVPVLVVWWD